MKKSKITVSILIIATAAIWGIVIFKIYNTVSSKSITKAVEYTFESDSSQRQIDTFSLVLNYKDPFLKFANSYNTNLTTLHHSSTIKEKKVVIQPIKNETPFPNFLFLGAVKNQKKNVSFVYVQINNEAKTMRIGDSYEGILLKKIFKDSIEVMYLNKLKVIKK